MCRLSSQILNNWGWLENQADVFLGLKLYLLTYFNIKHLKKHHKNFKKHHKNFKKPISQLKTPIKWYKNTKLN